MFIKTGTFTYATGVPSQSIITTFRPKAIIFWSVGAQANNVQIANPQPSYGFWADCGQEGYRTRSRFYYRSASIGSGINSHKDFLGTIGNYTGLIRSRSYAFTVDSVDASGFSITWTAAPPNGTIWHYQAIGGSEVLAYISAQSLSIPGSAANGFAAQVNGVPFKPQAVMAIATHGQVASTAGADISVGFMDESGAQFSASNNITVVNSGGAYGSSYTQYRNDSLVAGASTEMRLVATRQMDGISLLGYEGAGNAAARSLEVDFLFLGGVRSKAQIVQIPTTNVTQDINVGFKPRAAINVGWHLGLQSSGETPQVPNGYYLGGSVMVGGVDLLTGDKSMGVLVYTHATNGANGLDRNDLFWAATQTSYADTSASAFQRWIATTGVSGTNVQLTYAGANTKASYLGLFTLGDVTKPLSMTVSAEGRFSPNRLGTPHMLSAMMEADSQFIIQSFGTVGNIAGASFGAVSAFTVRGLSMAHPLTAVMAGAGGFAPRGLSLAARLSAVMAGVSGFYPTKPGNLGAVLSARMDAVSIFDPRWLRMSHNLSMAIHGQSRFTSRFKITIPTVPPAGPDDIPGTVNLHPNPSGEQVNLIGWFDEDGEQFNIERSSEQAWDGAYAIKHKAGSGADRQIVARSFAGLELKGLDATGNMRRMQGQLRAYAPSNAALTVYQRVEYTDGTIQEGDHADFIHPGGWSPPRYAPAIVLDPLKEVLHAEVVLQPTAGAAFSFYADGAQLEIDQGSGPTHWTIGTYGGQIGTWQGVVHASMSVRQPIPLVIHGIGRGGDVEVKGEMFRATWDNQWLEDVSDAVINCQVTMDAERDVTWQMDATFDWAEYTARITENVDWLAPVLTVTYPDGTVRRKQLGLYFVVPGAQTRDEYERTVKVSAFDPLWLLAKQGTTGVLRVQPLNERVRLVRDILDSAVLTGGDTWEAPPRYSGPNSGKGWKKKREMAGDQNKLNLANDVLEGAGMYRLWTIHNGEIRWRKRGDERMAQRKPVRQWAANLPPGTSVDATIPRMTLLKSEVVGAIQTSAEAMDHYDEILIVNDEPDTKRVRVRGRVRGRHRNRPRVVTGRKDKRKVKKINVPYVDDEASAAEIAAALADQLSNRVEGVEISVLPDPVPDYVHETVILAVWDAFGDPVAVGQYEVLNVAFGFTHDTCLQKMKLARVDDGSAEITVSVE